MTDIDDSIIDITPPEDVTNSSLSTFDECPHKYFLQYVLRLRPENTPDYFRIGGAYHLGHEVYGKTGSLEAAFEAIKDNYAEPPEHIQADDTLLEKWYFEAVTCACLFRGYHEHYANTPPDTVLYTEQSFRVPIRNPATGRSTPRHYRRGKIDKIVQLPDGRVALKEYKTSGQDIMPGNDYWWRLKIDSQVSGYYIAVREALDIQFHTVIYDVARKPTIRPSRVPVFDDNNIKIVLDEYGNRVRNKSGKKGPDGQYEWRQSADAAQGYVLQTRAMTLPEWSDKLMSHIRGSEGFGTGAAMWYYSRGEVVRLEMDLRDYETDLWSREKVLAEAERHNRWYKNTRSCLGRTRCAYFHPCTRNIDPTREIPEGFHIADVTHEELDG